MSSRHRASCCRAKTILPTATPRSRPISSTFIAPSVEDGRSWMSSMVRMARRDRRSARDRAPAPLARARPRSPENVKMQCVELHDDSENPIHCPFCGIKIAAGASEENVDAWLVGRCEHLLFAAIDEVGF